MADKLKFVKQAWFMWLVLVATLLAGLSILGFVDLAGWFTGLDKLVGWIVLVGAVLAGIDQVM